MVRVIKYRYEVYGVGYGILRARDMTEIDGLVRRMLAAGCEVVAVRVRDISEVIG